MTQYEVQQELKDKKRITNHKLGCHISEILVAEGILVDQLMVWPWEYIKGRVHEIRFSSGEPNIHWVDNDDQLVVHQEAERAAYCALSLYPKEFGYQDIEISIRDAVQEQVQKLGEAYFLDAREVPEISHLTWSYYWREKRWDNDQKSRKVFVNLSYALPKGAIDKLHDDHQPSTAWVKPDLPKSLKADDIKEWANHWYGISHAYIGGCDWNFILGGPAHMVGIFTAIIQGGEYAHENNCWSLTQVNDGTFGRQTAWVNF